MFFCQYLNCLYESTGRAIVLTSASALVSVLDVLFMDILCDGSGAIREAIRYADRSSY